MANNCSFCHKALRSTYIKCSKCDQLFHIGCIKTKLTEEQRNLYVCQPCQTKIPPKNKGSTFTNNSDKTPPDVSPPQADITPLQMLEKPTQSSTSTESSPVTQPEGLPALTAEIKLLRGDMGELKTHIKYLTEHLTQCYSRLDEYGARLTTLEKREEDIITLNNTVLTLRQQLNTQAQSALKNDVEIAGVTEHNNESSIHIIRTIGQKIGVTVTNCDIDHITRAGPKRQTSERPGDALPRPLVVRFVSRYKREEFLKAAKVRRTITTTDIEIPGTSKNIYFNERLTKENRQLFHAARAAAKEKGYKYCWHKNGAILLRKQEGNPAIHIHNTEDLERHLGPSVPDGQAPITV